MKKNAFTLIELLVVVAIIGILAAVGVVAYNGYTSSAKKNVAKQNHKLMVKEFQVMVTSFDINGSISRKINGGSSKTFNTKNSAFDCPAFQHHFKQIKSPYATSVEIGKDQDNQAWAGTPLLNDRGQILGIGSLYIADTVSPGIMSPGNMFVPVNILKPVLKDLISKGRRTQNINPYMGLSADDVTGKLNVTRVRGPAEKSGIQVGDLIISVNGTNVKSMEEFYKTAWKSGGPGSTIKIKVERDKKNLDYTLKSIDRMDYFVKNKGL